MFAWKMIILAEIRQFALENSFFSKKLNYFYLKIRL